MEQIFNIGKPIQDISLIYDGADIWTTILTTKISTLSGQGTNSSSRVDALIEMKKKSSLAAPIDIMGT